MRFAAGRSKNGAFGSPWVGGRIQGVSVSLFSFTVCSALKSAVLSSCRAFRSAVICVSSQYFSLAQMSTRSCNLLIVLDFFSSTAFANKTGEIEETCSWTFFRKLWSLAWYLTWWKISLRTYKMCSCLLQDRICVVLEERRCKFLLKLNRYLLKAADLAAD